MQLSRLLYDDEIHADRFINLLLAMLKSTSGRDLLLHIGSASADVLYYELTGIARRWNRVWHDNERAPLWPPAIEHPLGWVTTDHGSVVQDTKCLEMICLVCVEA
jgi:hypothetical protein